MVIFVGSNPSKKNTDPNVPFTGTKSWSTLENWIRQLGISEYKLLNVSNEVKPTKEESTNDLLTLKDEIYKIYYSRLVTIVALGNIAEKALKKLHIDYVKLPHPSGRNRQLNDKEFVKQQLETLKGKL